MRVVGVLGSGAAVASAVLPHGVDPARLLWQQGYAVVTPVDAARGADGDLVLTLRVAAPAGPEPVGPEVRTEDGLDPADTERAIVRQRVAAYAVVLSDRGLLATEFSGRTGSPGRWGLPGGGIDPGEEPAATVVREVHEETGQRVQVGELLQVQSSHWVGRAPDGTVEDFQAVRLVYRAACPQPSDPEVLDVGGTTSAARWVPRELIGTLDWAAGSRSLIDTWLTP